MAKNGKPTFPDPDGLQNVEKLDTDITGKQARWIKYRTWCQKEKMKKRNEMYDFRSFRLAMEAMDHGGNDPEKNPLPCQISNVGIVEKILTRGWNRNDDDILEDRFRI